MKHFLDLRDLTRDDLIVILAEAQRRKLVRGHGEERELLGQSIGLIFEKNSTRTRVSFEVGIRELGATPLVLQKDDLQLGRGETVADTARVLSRYLHGLMLRAYRHETLIELAQYASVPVINGLTNLLHPCQILADILTIEERLHSITGKTIAWIGDGNNVANTWITAAAKLDFTLRLACPASLPPHAEILAQAQAAGARVELCNDPQIAVAGADVVTTDTWVSMGDDDTLTRKQAFVGFQVNEALMKRAADHAIFLHCLPAHRGEEVSDAVLDGPQSAIWDEAENRLHVQKAIMLWCNEVIGAA
ncbi:MAG: ornithine carbamoyltransferase [Rhodospirillales bacterium 12-54-5]|nr:MAG: ornithine carbamoyltransferase [Rhodospirillales bacterium 12-54-5]